MEGKEGGKEGGLRKEVWREGGGGNVSVCEGRKKRGKGLNGEKRRREWYVWEKMEERERERQRKKGLER